MKLHGRTGKTARGGRVNMLLTGMLAVIATLGLLALAATRWTPSRDTYPVQGVAVSAANGVIDWAAASADGSDLAYIAVSDEKQGRDAQFAANWGGSRAAGLRYGAELAFAPCDKADRKARLFLTTVPRDNGALPPVISIAFTADCQSGPTPDVLLSELNMLLVQIEAHAGKPAILHLSRAIEDRYGIAGGINRTLWLDRIYFTADYAPRPPVIWGANPYRRVDGISGQVSWLAVQP